MMPGRILHRDMHPFSMDPYYLERPRLTKIIEEALQNPVVAVVAGQGYGKTSSIYAFLDHHPAVSVWVQLSERDNICQRFWENLCACIALRNAGLGDAMMKIGFPDTERLFDLFFNMIEQAIRAVSLPRYVFVYDDFHTINNPVMLRFFDRILAFPFSYMTVILISQTEPRIRVLPLLSKGFLAKITTEDLRFTPEEISAYFTGRGFKISPKDLNSLYRDTEGWPQLLTLAAQNLEIRGSRFRYTSESIKPAIFKMIEDSFFSSINKKNRKFLIKLSLTEHWPLELLGEMDGLGKRLEKLSPFISYDSYLNGYRIHRLLIEFLKEKQGELSREEQREMFLKSARWCLENNLRMDAAAYYEKARNYRGFIDLYFSYPVLIPRETGSFLFAVVERMLAEADGDPSLPENSDGDNRDALLYLRYALRPKLLTTMDRFEEAAAVCRGAIAKFEILPSSAVNIRILSSVYISLGFIQVFTCRFTKTYHFSPYFEKGYGYSQAYNMRADRNAGQGTIPSYICQVGPPAKAGEYEEYLHNIGSVVSLMEKFSNGFMAGMDYLGWCEYYYYKGYLGDAENYARQAIIRARENRQDEVENRGLFFLLRIAIHSGNSSEIENLCRQIKVQSETGDFQNRSIICGMEYAWFYAQTGSTALPGSFFKGGLDELEVDSVYYPLETLVQAKCFFAENRCHAALEVLERWKGRRSPQSCLVEKLEMTALEAVCCLRLERRAESLEKLEEAWALSAANGLDMPFIELGEDMRLLASAALEEDSNSRIPREWLETMRSRAAAYSKMLAAAVSALEYQNTLQNSGTVLRRSETVVLQSLSRGFTREEIARREGLSFYGVKEIIKNLYQKLGAVNRADAVRIAIDRGLLKNSRR